MKIRFQDATGEGSLVFITETKRVQSARNQVITLILTEEELGSLANQIEAYLQDRGESRRAKGGSDE